MENNIEFHIPVPEDKLWAEPLLKNCIQRGTDYSFPVMLSWGPFYGDRIGMVEGCYTAFSEGRHTDHYLYPAGGDVRKALSAIIEKYRGSDRPLKLTALEEEQKAELESLCPGEFEFTPVRDFADYLYTVDKLADLAGKKLHGKRNHIHRFTEAYSDWSYETMNEGNIGECLEMDKIWYGENSGFPGQDSYVGDNEALHVCLDNFSYLGLEGGIVRAHGRIVAFAVGSPMVGRDTYDIHFEKAFAEVNGAYNIINREFARWIRLNHPEVKYINREDDVGLEGLRRAKESYQPDILLMKYSAVLIKR